MIRTKLLASIFLGILCLAQQGSDPWTSEELVAPAAFAAELAQAHPPAKIIAVAFPVLYRQRHIAGAVYAGPGNKAEGIEALKKEVAGVSKDAEIVLYCGCCPMDKCPNIRPAYQALKKMGYSRVRVLSIPDNMHNDWYTKKYPSEPPIAEQ
jgi:3-mercaptopyruvate sulfurtransferase SseA